MCFTWFILRRDDLFLWSPRHSLENCVWKFWIHSGHFLSSRCQDYKLFKMDIYQWALPLGKILTRQSFALSIRNTDFFKYKETQVSFKTKMVLFDLFFFNSCLLSEILGRRPDFCFSVHWSILVDTRDKAGDLLVKKLPAFHLRANCHFPHLSFCCNHSLWGVHYIAYTHLISSLSLLDESSKN